MLDEITTLQFEGKLKAEVMSEEWWSILIAAFQKIKGAEFMPKFIHRKLQWGPQNPYLEWAYSDLDWQLIRPMAQKKENSEGVKRKYEAITAGTSSKHRNTLEAVLEQPLKKQKKSGNCTVTDVRKGFDFFQNFTLPQLFLVGSYQVLEEYQDSWWIPGGFW